MITNSAKTVSTTKRQKWNLMISAFMLYQGVEESVSMLISDARQCLMGYAKTTGILNQMSPCHENPRPAPLRRQRRVHYMLHPDVGAVDMTPDKRGDEQMLTDFGLFCILVGFGAGILFTVVLWRVI